MLAREARASGVLLHVTSLPSKFGIGDLGPAAFGFVDLLANSNQHYWSILPLTPTSRVYGNSPYMSESAFAGNPLLISPEILAEQGLIGKDWQTQPASGPIGRVDFAGVEVLKKRMLDEAYKAFVKQPKVAEFESFCSENVDWLDDYALYSVLREQSGQSWFSWPNALRNRQKTALTQKTEALADNIQKTKFVHFLFFSQWKTLKAHCRNRGIKVVGDLPFYVSAESADVWVHPEIFKLNNQKKPRYVSGVPPDYFSKTGQLWGTPVYDWQRLKREGFDWWLSRLEHNLKLYDFLRLDHFRGFIAYWQVPAAAKTARIGKWIRTPAKSFFATVKNQFPALPFVAEDLGVITKPVSNTITRLGILGMKVLLFAFDGDKRNPHLPQNHPQNTVVYTGTHDTNTVKGWFEEEASEKNKKTLTQHIGQQISPETVSGEFVKLALFSRANLCLVPMQDILGLGSEARMNNPARQTGNWVWRVTEKQLGSEKMAEFAQLTMDTNR